MGLKLSYRGVNGKRNGVGGSLKEDFGGNGLEVKREIRIKENKMVWGGNDPADRMQSIPRNIPRRTVIGADFREHDGAGI